MGLEQYLAEHRNAVKQLGEHVRYIEGFFAHKPQRLKYKLNGSERIYRNVQVENELGVILSRFSIAIGGDTPLLFRVFRRKDNPGKRKRIILNAGTYLARKFNKTIDVIIASYTYLPRINDSSAYGAYRIVERFWKVAPNGRSNIRVSKRTIIRYSPLKNKNLPD